MLSSCTFDLNYNVVGTGLNNGDFEFKPYIVNWSSWGKNNRAVVDNLLYTGAIIKKILQKGEKAQIKAKEKLKKGKEKVKEKLKQGKEKVKKSIKDRIAKEKKGIKEFQHERKERQLKEKEAKLEKEKQKLKEKRDKLKTKNTLLSDDFDSSDGSTSEDTSESMSSEYSSFEDEDDDDDNNDETSSEYETSTDEDEEYYPDSEDEEYILRGLNCNHGGGCTDCGGRSKEIKSFKEGKTQGPFNWPGTEGDKLRGDENLWLKLFIHTRHSGQKSIDKREAPFIERTQQAGVMKIPINNILIEIAKWMNNLPIDKTLEIKKVTNNQIKVFYKSVFLAPKLAKIEYNRLSKRGITDQKVIEEIIMNKCTKAEITTEITINNLTIPFMESTLQRLTTLQTQYNNIKYDQFVTKMKQQSRSSSSYTFSSNNNDTVAPPSDIYIPFGSTLHENILEKSMTPLINNYISSLFVDSPYGNKNHKALYQPSNKQVENLHLAYYSTEQGDQPVMGYLLRPRGEFDAKSEEYFLIQLAAALRRNGFSPAYFTKVINEQHKRTDDVIIHNYMKCVETIYNMASFAASLDLYTSDFRYGNDQFTKRGKQVQMDSWDYFTSQGISNCDDCEGMGSLALEILDAISEGRPLSGKKGWESPVLEAARIVLLTRSHTGVAGTVNDAFIDAKGQKISSKKIKDLPIIGEEIDTKSTVGGHFHGLSASNAIISKWLKNSVDIKKDNITQELKDFMNKDYKPWQYEENILVIEGTGNIDPFVLPLETSFKNDKIELNKRRYQKELCEFIKTSSSLDKEDDEDSEKKTNIKTEQALIRSNLESHKPNELFVLNHMVSVEAQPFYIKNTKGHNRISKFYKDIVHMLSKTLFRLDNSFSQCVFCYKNTKSFGVDIGDILRDTGNKESNIMIIRPLIPVNKDHWNVLINPLLDTIKRQQPLSILGNYTQEERSKLISKRLLLQDDTSQPSSSLPLNCMNPKETHATRTIKIRSEKGYYIINDKINNPVLLLEQGIQYNIEIDAKGHPFWILTEGDKKYNKNIENNGTDKGTIRIMIPCNTDPVLRYQCGKHSYMNGFIAIGSSGECGTSFLRLSTNQGDTKGKPIDYKYEKPKWHFDEVAQNPDQTIMKFFFRPFNLEKHPGFLKCLKDEISYLMKHKGVIDYVFYEQNFFPQGEPLVELLLLCNIKKKQ